MFGALGVLMRTLKVTRVFIKASECLSHFLCQSELPENVITAEIPDGKDFEIAVLNQNKLPRTNESLLSMLEAADMCPVDAFFIESSDGTIMNVWSEHVQSKIKAKEIEWA